MKIAPLRPNLKIVMLHTSHPGNIGSAARAMKNMGLTELVLVNPKSFPHREATSMACGADDLLENATICQSLDEAIADCQLVMGTTARKRTLSHEVISSRVAAEKAVSEAATAPVALVFGRERTGLTNEEIDRCHYLIHIPSNPDYNSLNVAAAIQVMSYELMMSAQQGEFVQPMQNEEPLAQAADVERYYEHLEQALIELEFLNPVQSPQLIPRLRRLFNRARLEQNEVNILRGILTAAQKAKRQ